MDNKRIIETARRYGACQLLKGSETPQEAIRLFVSPQGLEFYKKTGYPTIEAMRTYKTLAVPYGVYIDAGAIKLHNAPRAILVGDTQAELTYDDPATVRHQVSVLCGATATVSASNYAVVAVVNVGGTVATEIKEHAIIL